MTPASVSICLSGDDNFVPYIGTLIVSILENTNAAVDFYLLHETLKPENKRALSDIVGRYKNASLHFISIGGFDFYQQIGAWTSAILYRLKAPDVLSHLDKVIYLDGDMIAVDDIQKLWDIPLGDNYLGACYGLDITGDLGDLDPLKTVKTYFNSGMLLMNLKQMRADDIGNKCISFLKTEGKRAKAPDQDALNLICAGRIKPVNLQWNYYISLDRRSHRSKQKIFGSYLPKKPSIIHYYTVYKPVRFFWYVTHPVASIQIARKNMLFFKYLNKTPWRMKKEFHIKF